MWFLCEINVLNWNLFCTKDKEKDEKSADREKLQKYFNWFDIMKTFNLSMKDNYQ